MKTRLKEALKDAMRAKDQIKLDTIRSIISALQYEEIHRGVEALPEEAAFAVLKSELKKRKEELEFAEKGKRSDLQNVLLGQIACIESYLPSQLDSSALERIMRDFKSNHPGLNVGGAMKMLKDHYACQYDGKLASEVARKVLG